MHRRTQLNRNQNRPPITRTAWATRGRSLAITRLNTAHSPYFRTRSKTSRTLKRLIDSMSFWTRIGRIRNSTSRPWKVTRAAILDQRSILGSRSTIKNRRWKWEKTPKIQIWCRSQNHNRNFRFPADTVSQMITRQAVRNSILRMQESSHRDLRVIQWVRIRFIIIRSRRCQNHNKNWANINKTCKTCINPRANIPDRSQLVKETWWTRDCPGPRRRSSYRDCQQRLRRSQTEVPLKTKAHSNIPQHLSNHLPRS